MVAQPIRPLFEYRSDGTSGPSDRSYPKVEHRAGAFLRGHFGQPPLDETKQGAAGAGIGVAHVPGDLGRGAGLLQVLPVAAL